MVAKNESFDLIIIGSGPGGYVAAVRAGQLGLKTALVEKDAKFGGTCLHRGCIPTKSLLHSADLYREAKAGTRYGVECENVRLNYDKVQDAKSRSVKKLSMGIEFLLKKNNVSTVRGYGKIASVAGGTKTIEISGDAPATIAPATIAPATIAPATIAPATIAATNVILATGSEPRALPGLEPDGKGIITNNEALELTAPPASILIVGAGAVGIEFASMFRDFGSTVTVVELLPTILPIEDAEVSAELAKIFKKRGIEIATGAKVASLKPSKEGYHAVIDGGGKKVEKTFEKVLVAVGRKPNTDGLGLEKTKVKVDRGFILVNEYMETAEPGIYAIGDIVPTPQLAHVASAEGLLAVERIKGGHAHPIDYRQVPSCVYCHPQVASIGLSEKKAIDAGHAVKVGRFPFSASGKASILGEIDGFVKVVADKQYGEILGVHIVGPSATELIAEAGAALRGELCAADLAGMIHAHPTLAESIAEAVHAVDGGAIHV